MRVSITELKNPDVQTLIRDLFREGLRVKKLPWCCDSTVEAEVSRRLLLRGILGQETREQTLARRLQEEQDQ
jgi:hypothetical protein